MGKRKTAGRAAFGLLAAAWLLTACAVPQEMEPEIPEKTAAPASAFAQAAEPAAGEALPDTALEENSPDTPEDTAILTDVPEQGKETPAGEELLDAAAKEERRKIVENMVTAYGTYGRKADQTVADLLQELRALSPDAAARWERIMALWSSLDTGLSVQYNILPDGLPDTDELCIVALGLQLGPSGSMRPELIGRLEVVKKSAEKYPNAWIVCTGGGTAANNPDATEAGKMAEWLIDQGLDESRILVEDRSKSTVQNALYTYDLLVEKAPQVTQLAIVSSEYHIPTGWLFFEAEAILRADNAAEQKMTVVANAAYPMPNGTMVRMLHPSGLIELFRAAEAAAGD